MWAISTFTLSLVFVAGARVAQEVHCSEGACEAGSARYFANDHGMLQQRVSRTKQSSAVTSTAAKGDRADIFAHNTEDVDQELWPLIGDSNSRCVKGAAKRGLTQSDCQKEAIANGHAYYSYAASADGTSSCHTSAGCDSPITGTTWDWKVYHETSTSEEADEFDDGDMQSDEDEPEDVVEEHEVASVFETLDLSYGGNAKHTLDMYWPDTTPPVGGWLTVLAVHGAGATKSTFSTFCKIIAQTGRLCIAINYRSEADIGKALDWTMSHASSYNINKDRIILYGQSKGGFKSGLVLWDMGYDYASRIAGAILVNGMSYGTMQIVKQSTPSVKIPVLVVGSENDNVVPYQQSQNLVNHLQEAGNDVTFVSYKKAGHNPRKGAGSLYEYISEFLTKFEIEPPPTVIHASTLWPQVDENSGIKCFNSGSAEIKGIDRSACQTEADKLGHRYIQYSSNGKLCATSETCDNVIKNSNGWKVFWRPQSLVA